MAQPQMMQIKLSRFDAQPWGFRLQGGTDFAQPLLVQKVNGGSLAEQAGLMPGDAVIKINDVDVFNLRHKEAQDIVVRSGNNFVMTVQRGGSTWRPHVQPTGNVPQPNQSHLQTVTKTSLAHKQQDSQHIGCGYNNAAKPFGNTVDGNVKSIVNKQYNTPVGIYSDESIAETLSAQAEVLAGGVLGVNFKKNEKEYQADKSEVLKFLREEESGTSTPAFGNYPGQDHQQQQQQTQYQPQQQTQYQPQQQSQYQPPQQQYQPSATKHVTAPVTQPKPPSTGGLPVGQNICYNCERLITGVFVRIKDKNLHVECFKCATCGTSLKNQGYYNFNNKLYCDIHAKLAAMQNPPPGTDGYVPVPIKPNTKLSASTITSALSAHGFNGVSNGNSTPTPAPQPEEMNLNDLPLPPPPSPTQLQQFEEQNTNNNSSDNNNSNIPPHTRTLSSLSSMSSGSNTTHSSTHSLSPTPYSCFAQVNQQTMAGNQATSSTISLDHYGSSSPLHSRQTSSSSSSLSYGIGSGGSGNSDNYVSSPLPPPPPPPPMPQQDNNADLYINTMKQHNNASNNNTKWLTRQNENDKNSYNKAASKAPGLVGVSGGGGGVTAALPTTQKVYNKFLKEYSNKLLTQNKNGDHQQQPEQQIHNYADNNNTLPATKTTTMAIGSHNNNSRPSHTFINNSYTASNTTPKPFIPQPSNANGIFQKQQHQHSLHSNNKNNNNISIDADLNNTSLPSVAALTATLNNQLKFDSCQVAPQQQLLPTTTTATPPSSNLPIVDKSLINSDNTKNASNSNIICNNSTNNNPENFNTTAVTNDMSSTMASSRPSISEQSASNGVGGSAGDKPFEYVTLTGNVIRSVVPPGKGTNVNYKVNQGYARPYGAPPAAAPKSPVTFPPQPQQWNAPPPTQPKPTVPAGNPYATLPRSNVGQGQESITKPQLFSDTLPRKSNANPKINAFSANAVPVAVNSVSLKQQADLPPPPPPSSSLSPVSSEDPTAMLNASLSKINMDIQMNNFMAEAGKVISNMLEARLANGGPSPQSGSSLSLRSNSSSNLSRSPMVVRKRLDLDDFKDINPIEPAALKPVIAVQQNVELKNPNLHQEAPGFIAKGVYTQELNANHPMGKVLDICDNKFKPTSPLAVRANVETTNAQAGGNLPPSETVIYRNNERSNRRASHAMDRRSYIESNGQSEKANKDGPVFSINVKALGKEGTDPNKPMSPENEQVVSQLLKEGKRPICCQCNNEITSGPFITALGKIWCPEHFHCVNANCRRPLQDIGFVEEKGDLYCEYCFEKYLAPSCSKCGGKIKGDCLNAIGKHFHPECFSCGHCGKLFGNTPFFLEDGMPYCEADWNELFTTKCFACGFPVEAGDRWVEALNHNYHSQCFNCTYCKQNLEGQSFYNKGGRPFCKNHAR